MDTQIKKDLIDRIIDLFDEMKTLYEGDNAYRFKLGLFKLNDEHRRLLEIASKSRVKGAVEFLNKYIKTRDDYLSQIKKQHH